MPAYYEDKKVRVFSGMTCDACHKDFPDGNFDFVLNHTFGYGTEMDMAHVEAAICDKCLIEIIRDRVPGAEISNHP